MLSTAARLRAFMELGLNLRWRLSNSHVLTSNEIKESHSVVVFNNFLFSFELNYDV